MFKSMSKKQKKLFYRIIISAVLFALCLFIPKKYLLLRGICFAFPYAVGGYDIVIKAIRNIKNGQIFDENLLMGIATAGAYSLCDFSEAVMVVILYQAGELFQSMAVSSTRRSIAKLMDIRPDFANLLSADGTYKTVSPEEVKVGDTVLIKSGEKVPLDCTVLSGESEVDTSSLTGESVPRDVKKGDVLSAGFVNISGTVYASVNKTFGESTVSKVLELAEKSAQRKSKSENFITKFAKYYTPAVCFLALLMAAVPTVFFGNFTAHLKSALVFLVVSCPCALVISVPLSFFCGMGCASKNGILIKGSSFMEKLAKADTVIFDKTGTLTTGKLSVTEIVPENGFDNKEILTLAALAETHSNHPMAVAIRNECDNLLPSDVSQSKQIIGKGVCATVKGKNVCVGNASLMKDENIAVLLSERTETALYVSVDGKYAGVIYVSDKLKTNAKEALKALKSLGVGKTVMLTGDKETVGEKIAKDLSIDEVHCELLPDKKVELAEKTIAGNAVGKSVAYVGDGINDAPVLSRADVGIAMGGIGSDAAIEAADVVIMDDDPQKIPLAMRISKKTVKIVKQNIVFALGVKILVMIISSLGYSNMWLAIFADVGVSVIAIFNALRTFKISVRK